ncbi:efflux RND transporter periplasmic adaptor subunit [Gluconobacter cerinus]|mgnify:FL=1|uniref:efflux RND transporter periplasmic adaptor subunit n=1 Tax=Gluconobacter cerinus TaxID=38307 RepID=UPI001B8BAAE1|nr:efflux RND transporter periplasmic adaptor subunit [Gluconobacter cerinus]MBS1025307.1 efflux RND transporter periplasmic adaptor subunit [Gluconobacter cerinus]MBS1043245.1 efflux RND transporter periplasmic adaptor subunit [Gluconobacter cerinus]
MRVARASALALGLLGLVFLVLFLRTYFFAPPHAATPEQPMFARQNGSLVLRDGSPLQKRLVVAPVSLSHDTAGVALPAQVVALPDHQVNVLAPATGRIMSVAVQLGQHVSRGQVLATIAASDLDQAWADDRRARAALDFSKRAYDRARGVLAAGGNAVKDLESARNDLAQAEAEALRTHQRLQVLGARSDYAAQGQVPLVSPVDGVVSTTNMAVGQNITDSTAIQMTLLDLSSVWVAAAVPESRMSDITSGATLDVTFPALPGQTCSGPVATRDPALKPDTRRLNVYVVCPNTEGLLRPGMFASANLGVSENDVVRVPKSALLMNNDQVSVFVEVAPGTFRRREVTINYDEGDDVLVLSGLSAGERVVTSGAILLNDD